MSISRRLWRLTAGSAILAILVACSPAAPAPSNSGTTGGSAPAPAASPTPNVPQILNYGTHQFPSSLDTRVVTTGSARRGDIYETIVVQDTSGKTVQPMIAKSWEIKDPTTWEFTIVTDRKFHDGTAMTVDDVVFSLQDL